MKRLSFLVLLVFCMLSTTACFSFSTDKEETVTTSERRSKSKKKDSKTKESVKESTIEESSSEESSADESSVSKEGDTATSELKSDRLGTGDEKTATLSKFADYNNPFIYLKGYNDWKEEGDLPAFELAPEYKYTGYIIWIDDNSIPRDAYVPFGGNLTMYSNYVVASNRGVTVTKTMIDGEKASSLLEQPHQYYNTKVKGAKVGQMRSFDNDTVGLIPFYYEEEYEGELYKHFGIYYVDIRDGGKRYVADEIIFTPKLFDESTGELIKEMEDVYSFNPLTIDENNPDAWISMNDTDGVINFNPR